MLLTDVFVWIAVVQTLGLGVSIWAHVQMFVRQKQNNVYAMKVLKDNYLAVQRENEELKQEIERRSL